MNEVYLIYIMFYLILYIVLCICKFVVFIGQMDIGQIFNFVGFLLMDLNGNMFVIMMNNGKERCLKGIR